MGNRKQKSYPTIKDQKPHNQNRPYTGHCFVNIRGTNGSGKTYLVNQLTKDLPGTKHVIDGIKVTEYDKFYVIGSYDKACGGLDTITDFYAIAPLIHKLIETKHVLGEGLIFSGVYRSSHKLGEDLRAKGHQMLWLCLNTDAQTCIDNVCRRRWADGRFKPFKSENLIKKMAAVQTCNNNAIAYGENVVIGDTDMLKEAFELVVYGGMPPIAFCNPKDYFHFEHLEELAQSMPVIEAPAKVVQAYNDAQAKSKTSIFDQFGV